MSMPSGGSANLRSARLLSRRALFVLLAVFAIALATPAGASAAKPCWKQIIDDWYDNERIDGVYEIKCYGQAYDHLGEDLKAYSDLPGELERARQAALRARRQMTPEELAAQERAGRAINPVRVRRSLSSRQGGPIREALNELAPSEADSTPVALLVLAGLALLLMAAGATGMVTRKLRLRKARAADAPPPP